MTINRWLRSTRKAVGIFVSDVGNGLLEVSHNGLAFVGLVVLTAVVFVAGQSEIRHDAEKFALDWLQQRHEWPGLKGVVIIESLREIPGASPGTDKIERETRFYITSLVWLAHRWGR